MIHLTNNPSPADLGWRNGSAYLGNAFFNWPYPGYTAAYSLDETSGTRVDLSGTYSMTPVGTVGYTTGIVGNAVVTSGGGGWLDSVKHIDLTNTSFTVCAWIKSSASQTGSTPNPAVSQWQSGNGGFLIGPTGGTTYTFSPSGLSAVTGGTYTNNAWQFLVGRFTRGSEIALFVNGTKYATATTATTITDSTSANLKIGTLDFGGEFTFQGAVDRVSLHKTALTDAQIQALYQAR